MQGELADSGSKLTQSSHVTTSPQNIPSLAAQKAFSEAASSSSGARVTQVGAVEAAVKIDNIQSSSIKDISNNISKIKAIEKIDSPHWQAKQLLDEIRPKNSSMMDRSYSYMEGFANERQDAMKNVLSIDKQLQPITNFMEESQKKNIEKIDMSTAEMSPSEQFEFAQKTMREAARESMVMQGLSVEANSKIAAASMNVNITIAIYRWAKELSTGVVKIIKNTVNNTR